MSLYLCHRGAFTRQPLKCRAAPCCSNVRRMAWAVCTYGRPWYLPRGWLSDLLEDLNILWARENWICQGAVLLLCASFQVFDTDMSLCPSQWAKMLPLSGGKEQRWHLHWVTHETWARRFTITCVTHHHLANKTDFKTGIEMFPWQAQWSFKPWNLNFNVLHFPQMNAFRSAVDQMMPCCFKAFTELEYYCRTDQE